MKAIRFTHATTQQPIMVSEHLAFSWWHSPGHKATHILGNGGGVVPVLESFEEVTQKIEAARAINKTIKGESANGTN